MAAKVLLPGQGGKYVTETFDSNATILADTIDCSQMDELVFQLSSTGSPGGTAQAQQTFNMQDWVSLGGTIAATDGTVLVLDITDGPFGIVRFDATNVTAGSSETLNITIVGHRIAMQ